MSDRSCMGAMVTGKSPPQGKVGPTFFVAVRERGPNAVKCVSDPEKSGTQILIGNRLIIKCL